MSFFVDDIAKCLQKKNRFHIQVLEFHSYSNSNIGENHTSRFHWKDSQELGQSGNWLQDHRNAAAKIHQWKLNILGVDVTSQVVETLNACLLRFSDQEI